MPDLTTSPWDKTLQRLGSKSVVGSKLRSAEWGQVPVALRERAFFSAGVENTRILGAMRDKAMQGLAQARVDGTGMNKARFVADMRAMLGADPGNSDSLTDMTSRRRLELIWDFQTTDAHAQAAHVAGLDPDILDAFPAYRFTRIEDREHPREWFPRWLIAAASVGFLGASKTETIGLKTSGVWKALSRFGRPWPPFDYNSGMGLEDADRGEAEAAGLLNPREPVADRVQRLRQGLADANKRWNDGLKASVKDLGAEARGWLKSAFGDQIRLEGDTAVWAGSSATTPPPPTPTTAPVAVPAAEPTPAPSGPSAPVSNALDNRTRGDLAEHIDTAMDAVDSVHDDGDLPAIPIRRLETGGSLGQYQWNPKTGEAANISIRDEPASWPGLTTAHEIGHFLDHQVLGTRGTFASIADPLLAEFRAAVRGSEAVAQIRTLLGEGYFTDPRELWARAYAQFIATRSGDPRLLAQLDRTRKGPQSWRQWSDEDFKPIADAIEAVMKKKGWMK